MQNLAGFDRNNYLLFSLIAFRYKGSNSGKKREYAIESASGARHRRVIGVPDPCLIRVIGQKVRPLSHFRHVTLKNPLVFYTFEIRFSNVFLFNTTFHPIFRIFE